MRAVDVIRNKRDGLPLTSEEINAFVDAATHQTWPDYQISALLMAIVCRGMTPEETARLTEAMVHSGTKLDWSHLPGTAIDKHSSGGVGDKTSLILAPLAAACGVLVPMMSGRGLGHSGGTLDKLESIPGFRVGLSLDELKSAMEKVGCAMIGQTAEVAPADRKLYALRDVTATVESIPLISASILSKKIAEGITGLVMDVKCGRGAFMKTREDAQALAQSLIRIGELQNVRTEAVITAMDSPLGRAVGNSLEVIEAIETLQGKGPKDLEDLSVHLAARMLRLAGKADTLEEAEAQVRSALISGAGLVKLSEIIVQQGGDPMVVDELSRLPLAEKRHVVKATQPGFVQGIDAERVGVASMILGAGRSKVDDVIDPGVGILLLTAPGEPIRNGEGLAELYYQDEEKLTQALAHLEPAFEIGEEAVTPELILETLDNGSDR